MKEIKAESIRLSAFYYNNFSADSKGSTAFPWYFLGFFMGLPSGGSCLGPPDSLRSFQIRSGSAPPCPCADASSVPGERVSHGSTAFSWVFLRGSSCPEPSDGLRPFHIRSGSAPPCHGAVVSSVCEAGDWGDLLMVPQFFHRSGSVVIPPALMHWMSYDPLQYRRLIPPLSAAPRLYFGINVAPMCKVEMRTSVKF